MPRGLPLLYHTRISMWLDQNYNNAFIVHESYHRSLILIYCAIAVIIIMADIKDQHWLYSSLEKEN